MPHFGKRSLDRLETCHPDLQKVMNQVVLIRDITIIQGFRDRKLHEIYREAGKTKVSYERTKHGRHPSEAVDIAPFEPVKPHIRWNDKKSWYALGGLVIGVAWSMGVALRWGGDWDHDWSFEDQTFHDLPHFELIM